MRRKLSIALVALLAAIGTAIVIAAVNFHNTSCSINSDFSVTCSGKISGLGEADATVTISGSGTATTLCANKGGKQAPGQNPAAVVAAGEAPVDNTGDQNGQRPFTVTSIAPEDPTAQEAGCPNGNWDASISGVTYPNGVTLTVSQGGVTVAQLSGIAVN